MSPAVADAIALLVSIVWSIVLVADFIVPNYSPPVYAHLVAGGIIGSIFGFRVVTVTRQGGAPDGNERRADNGDASST